MLLDNWPMLSLLSRLGCEFAADDDPEIVRATRRFDNRAGTPVALPLPATARGAVFECTECEFS